MTYMVDWALETNFLLTVDLISRGNRDSLLVKVASSNPGRSDGRIFFSRVSFVY